MILHINVCTIYYRELIWFYRNKQQSLQYLVVCVAIIFLTLSRHLKNRKFTFPTFLLIYLCIHKTPRLKLDSVERQ